MERKTYSIPFAATKIDEVQGIVEHIFAVFGNLDEGHDIVHPGSFTKTLAERGQSLRTAMPEAPAHVDGDPARITQVVENLLSNASKYTPEGGDITLALETGPGAATLSVRDTGIGLAREHLDRVFELFAQLDTSPERVRGGLGIGLALVRELVAMHGGRAWAESDGPGRHQLVVALRWLVHGSPLKGGVRWVMREVQRGGPVCVASCSTQRRCTVSADAATTGA